SARKKRGDSDTSLTPPIATPTPITTATPVPRLSAAAKGKQPASATTPTELPDFERTEAEQLKIPRRPPTPDRDWNKTLPAAQGNAQSWISELARQTDARSSFNEL
nr:hypothetical protein [Tanacetum cinerariifolium]